MLGSVWFHSDQTKLLTLAAQLRSQPLDKQQEIPPRRLALRAGWGVVRFAWGEMPDWL